jgi:protoporphyrin/coproporphyrin ferrochelatase
LPQWVHNLFFTRLAKKRAMQVCEDYAAIGGKSPIYEDTEAIAEEVGALIKEPIVTFHRYLPATHAAFIETLRNIHGDAEVRIFPLFAQFSCATTGSIATWFAKHLPSHSVKRMQWIRSYPAHKRYIAAFESRIRHFLEENQVEEARCILLFSAHGLPEEFIRTGDVYQKECELTFERLSSHFPKALSRLCYQSQFGKQKWIGPSTPDLCSTIDEWGVNCDTAVIVPLSFTSDHIETLFEVEKLYIPLIVAKGLRALRCPALNRDAEWISALAQLLCEEPTVSNQSLLRRGSSLKLW